jgi:hypothetical protein
MSNSAGTTEGFRRLAEPLAAITRRVVARRGFPHPGVIQHWPDIVGPEAARYSLPERIDLPRRQRDRGTLMIRVASPSVALELLHSAPAIVAAFNLYCGRATIVALRLRHAPLPPPDGERREDPSPTPAICPPEEVESDLVDVSDQDLRAALNDLGQALSRHKETR